MTEDYAHEHPPFTLASAEADDFQLRVRSRISAATDADPCACIEAQIKRKQLCAPASIFALY